MTSSLLVNIKNQRCDPASRPGPFFVVLLVVLFSTIELTCRSDVRDNALVISFELFFRPAGDGGL